MSRPSDVHLPGRSVRIRPIFPKLARQLEDRAMKQGKLDVNELQMLRFFHGVTDPSFTLAEVRTIFSKDGPSVNLINDRIDEISGTPQVAVDHRVAHLHRRALQMASTATSALQRQRRTQPRARQRRGAPCRASGSRRGATTRSSAASGDSGDGDPEPPRLRLRRRLEDLDLVGGRR